MNTCNATPLALTSSLPHREQSAIKFSTGEEDPQQYHPARTWTQPNVDIGHLNCGQSQLRCVYVKYAASFKTLYKIKDC
jgi:hypothetical protein